MTWTMDDYVIEVDEYGVFRANVDDHSICEQTLEGAKEQISKQLERKKKASKRKLNLAVVDEYGDDNVITGIHAGNGKLLLAKPTKRGTFNRAPSVYTLRDDIVALVHEVNDLDRKLTAKRKQLSSYRIEAEYKEYGKPLDVEASLDKLERLYKERVRTQVPSNS